MNIWFLCKYASPEKYHFGTRHFYLSEEWVKMGHRVAVVTSNATHMSDQLPKFKGKVWEEEINGVKTFWLNTFRSKTSTGISRILSWLHFEWQLFTMPKRNLGKPDVVIASSLSLFTILNAWYFARRHKAKLVFEIRDIWPLSAIVLGNVSERNPMIRIMSRIEKFGYLKAHAIVGTIPNLEAHVRKVAPQAVRCHCIPQGINLSFYERQQALPADYFSGLPNDAFIICYAGTISINNPLSSLIEAARMLSGEPVIHFVIVGDGSNKSALQEAAAGLPNVHFLPPVRKNQVNHLLSQVHICYDSFDSKLADYGLSRNKWIDYMFAAKPIICAYNGFRSMVNEADAGSFVTFGDSKALAEEILRYYQMSRGELAEIGRRGKEFLLQNRTFDKLANQYIEIIQQAKL